MAKVSKNDIVSMSQDWGYDSSTGLPYSGRAVQKFIKEQFGTKMGYFFYDTSGNRYLVFASEESKDEYLANPTKTELILGSFDAPFNYEAEINLLSDSYVAVPLGTTGNVIEFTFKTKNKNGDEIPEDVVCTYTIVRGSMKKKVSQRYRSGQHVRFNVDKYLSEGANRITIGIVGQTTFAATTTGVTYQVANLTLTDNLDIAKLYNLTEGEQVMEIPFTLSGTGAKTMEWYLNGTMLPFDKNVDEVVDSSSSRVKYITLSGLARGVNKVEYRAYTLIEGEKFYSKTLHRDIIVENYDLQDGSAIIAMAYEKKNLESTGIDIEQYIAYDLRFAIHNPQNTAATPVEVYVGGNLMATVNTENGIENSYSILLNETGTKELKVVAGGTEYTIQAEVSETSMSVREITEGLELGFSAVGRNNSMSNKNKWEGNDYTGTLSGFSFTQTSGWVNNRLLMQSGSKITFNYAPLASESTSTGKTLEFEFASSNVSDDNTVLCDLRNESGTGILITASEASITSRGGTKLSVKYKPEENTRISFVINRATGVTNKGLVFIYVDGIISGATNFGSSDDFKSDKMLEFAGVEGSEILLKQVRTYTSALSSDQILNNFTLYRDTTAEMLEVYNRNNIFEEDSQNFSVDTLQGQLPVMIVTGDIPTLENTTNKDTQITVDIEYYNLQDNEKSFVMKNAAMRPQGTSSMLYPKKNFRIYTQKLENTELYDGNGNLVQNKLYAFKEGSQPVNCWCLKADYAESSGTHNTGIAKLWHEVLYNSTINGEFVFRTEAQKKALESGYPYDVRTTIDGFPILMFYRESENDDLIFIGKYNFNNDKSTESVFGFTGIPNFDNSHMQCWEILNNGDALALFTNVSDFDSRWADAFESRYPDTKTPNTADLKAFSVWLNSMNGNAEAFATEKWEHMNVYMMAAYYVYLMRFGAVDQTVKNAMLTSEDGQKFYFINYDNDTINGLRNNGVLVFDPTIDRQSLDPETGGLAYAYAGHDSVLWNMLEGDAEFMQIVKDVDNALYANGLSYDRVIQVFNEQQADQWNERVYNQDAQYKYISPYTDSSLNNLEMLQGKRQSHRMWWLSRRFSLYDSKFVSGDFKGKALEFKVINNTEAGWTFGIEAGTDMEYGYGVYNPIETGVALQKGETHNFTITQTLNIGDPVRIYSAVNLQGVDLSNILPRLSNVELNNVYNDAMGTRLKKLVLGNGLEENTVLSSISSIAKAKRLESLDIRGCKGIITLDLSGNIYLKTLRAMNSGLTSVEFAKGAPITRLELPNTLQTLRLEQLVSLAPSGLVVEDNGANIRSYNVLSCPLLSNDINTVFSWFNHKTAEDRECTLYMDNVNWVDVTPEDFLKICTAKTNGMNITLRGRVKLTTSSQEIIDAITAAFGSLVFKPTNELYINAPDAIYLAGPSEILEGQSAQFTAAVFTENYGTVTYSISSGSRTGVTINAQTGYLTSVENGNSDSTLTIRAMHRPTTGTSVYVEKQLKIKKRIYPSSITINGSTRLNNEQETYTWSSSTTGITGDYRVEWELTGDILEYANIETFNKERCIIRKTQDAVEEVTGVLTVKIIKNVNGSTVSSATKTVLCLNPDILMTKTSNPEAMACMWQAGLCANENYMTKTEAGSITDIDLMISPSDSIFYKYGKSIKTFDEFEYFTLLESVPAYCFYDCRYLKSIKLPNSIKTIKSYAFYLCVFEEIIIPESVTKIESAYFPSSLRRIYGASCVESIARDAFESIKVEYIEETATFGLYYHTYTNGNLILINGSTFDYNRSASFLLGTKVTFKSKYGTYFDDLTNSRTLTIGYTGSAEDLTNNKLKLWYSTVEIVSNMRDAEFNITYTSYFDGTEKTIVKGVGEHIIDITPNSTMKINAASEFKGYNFKEITTTAYLGTTTVNANFAENSTVGIAHKDGTFYTTDEWTSGGYSNDDAEGVCIITQATKRCIIIAKENASADYLAWGGYNKTILGIITASSNEDALLDFDGVGNTPKIIEQCEGYTYNNITGAPAAEACANYTFPSGAKGYLPAVGEWKIASDNKSAVDSAMSIIDGTGVNGGYWSSTQNSESNSWYQNWSSGSCSYSNKLTKERVRAFSAYVLTIKSNLATKFTVSYTNNDGEQMTKIVMAGNHTMNVKIGTQVTVTPDAVGNLVAEPQTFTWTGFRHECSFAFAKDAGVYIQHKDGSLYTESEWTAGGYANSDANGVALLSETHPGFVIAKQDASSSTLPWGGYGKTITGIVSSTDSAVALLDFDGIGNTPKIIEQCAGYTDSSVTGAPAAEACAAYTFPSGQKGYLPALGEWKIASDNKSAVDSAMALIGGTEVKAQYYGSSTQKGSSYNWILNWGTNLISDSWKQNKNGVRAFAAL
jgi:hypothetical protein